MYYSQILLVSLVCVILCCFDCRAAPVVNNEAVQLPSAPGPVVPFNFQPDHEDIRTYNLTPEEVEELRFLSEEAVRNGEAEIPVVEERSFLSAMNHIWDFLGFRKFQEWLKKKRLAKMTTPAPIPVYIINPPHNAPKYPFRH